MTVAKHYSPKPNIARQTSWIMVVMMSGFLCGLLLFVMGWYFTLPQNERDVVLNKLMSTGDIFPGIMGLHRSKTLLVMGVDMPPGNSRDAYRYVRTDTMMLVKIDARHKKINIVSIPRDSKVYIAGGHGVDKINAAFPLGGAETAVATVEQTLGVDIDNYLVINLRGVKDVINALGGIDVYIEKPMHYRDRTAGLNIALQPGQHHLSGEEAEGFLRFRHDALGDIGRIRRQQQFVSAVTRKLKDPSVLLKIKPLLEASSKYMLTDMSTQDLVGLALFAKGVDKSGYQVATLPGHPSLNSAVSYWVIDSQAAEEVLNRLIVGDDSSMASEGEVPRIGILYTADHTQDIATMKAQLEAQGFDVICSSPVRRSVTKLITHNSRFGQETQQKLEQFNPAVKDAQLIFFPHGATFETNSCGQSDYTIVLGDDTRSTAN